MTSHSVYNETPQSTYVEMSRCIVTSPYSIYDLAAKTSYVAIVHESWNWHQLLFVSLTDLTLKLIFWCVIPHVH